MTAPQGEAAAAAVSAYVTQQAAAAATLNERLLAGLAALWAAIGDYRDPDALGTFGGRAVQLIRAAEVATGRVTETYLRRVFRSMDVPVPVRPMVALPASLRYGTPLDDVVQRPAATVRYLRSVDAPEVAAVAAGAARLEALGETQIQLATRAAADDVYAKVSGITGYRRVIRPELSKSGSCGLCIAASDRIYKRGDLLPIHDKCKCITLPITRFSDPGLRINDDDLDDLYKRAGGTNRARLSRVRYRIEQHGELGPVLVPEGRSFRSAADAGEAVLGAGRRTQRNPADRLTSYRKQLDTLEASIPALERRAAAGEDVTAALTWQRARAEELRTALRGRTAA